MYVPSHTEARHEVGCHTIEAEYELKYRVTTTRSVGDVSPFSQEIQPGKLGKSRTTETTQYVHLADTHTYNKLYI